jgi:tRNA threonylcarbamoyl adenosine modification protein YjeE
VTLRGELGTGKTTFARGLLRRLGVTGSIRSPTYTLIEPYEAGGLAVHHLDLYRIANPDELELMGTRDLLADGGLVLVEWPERAGRLLPNADLALDFEHARPVAASRLAQAARPGGPCSTPCASRPAARPRVRRLRAALDKNWRRSGISIIPMRNLLRRISTRRRVSTPGGGRGVGRCEA